jgi:surfactin synthase thioesterase subunit
MKAPMSNPWLQHWHHKPHARIRLFCFPYAGGGASLFRAWSEYLPQDIEVCPVQLPGREKRLLETPFSHMPALIDMLVSILLPYIDMPYALFGHSMGALICFELARRLYLAEHISEPVHLLISGHHAPQLPDPTMPIYYLPDPEFIEGLRRLKGTPEEMLQNEELLPLLLPVLRADFSLCEMYKYIHLEPLRCPITVFGGSQDLEAPPDTLVAWREQTSGPFKVHLFSGDHFFLHQEQPALLEALSLDLFASLNKVTSID